MLYARLMRPVRLSALILPAMLAGCGSTTNLSGPDASFCSAARAIYWSSKDTDQTLAQVREHNAVGKTLCGWGKK